MTNNKKNPLNSNTEDRPFFSIIIPVFNAASYLRECMECILKQSCSDWEAVLVDDASSDSSVAIAEEYSKADSRIKVFRSERNSGGAYEPRIRAAKLARGRYIVTIDADDKVSSDLLDSLRLHIIKDKADLVIPEMWRMTESEIYKILPLDSIDASAIWRGRDLVSHTLVKWEIPMCGFAIRRDIYLEADSNITADDRKSIFADELLSRWILYLSTTVSMCDARYYYRQNEDSVTHVNLPRIINGRMHTCDGLISMAATAFGEMSPTFERALENKLYSAVDMMRTVNRSKLDRRQTREAERCISSHMKELDLSRLKGKTSPRYLALMGLPASVARYALRIIDLLIAMKNGI